MSERKPQEIMLDLVNLLEEAKTEGLNLSSNTKEKLANELYNKYKKEIEKVNQDVATTIQVDVTRLGQNILNKDIEAYTKHLIREGFESFDMENVVREEIGSNIANLKDDIKNLDAEVMEVKGRVTELKNTFERMTDEKKRTESIFKGFNDKIDIFLKPFLLVCAVGLLFSVFLSVTNATLLLSDWYYPMAKSVFESGGIIKSILGGILHLLPAVVLVRGIWWIIKMIMYRV